MIRGTDGGWLREVREGGGKGSFDVSTSDGVILTVDRLIEFEFEKTERQIKSPNPLSLPKVPVVLALEWIQISRCPDECQSIPNDSINRRNPWLDIPPGYDPKRV